MLEPASVSVCKSPSCSGISSPGQDSSSLAASMTWTGETQSSENSSSEAHSLLEARSVSYSMPPSSCWMQVVCASNSRFVGCELLFASVADGMVAGREDSGRDVIELLVVGKKVFEMYLSVLIVKSGDSVDVLTCLAARRRYPYIRVVRKRRRLWIRGTMAL